MTVPPPANMNVGDTASVTVQCRNTGTSTWIRPTPPESANYGFKLGFVGLGDFVAGNDPLNYRDSDRWRFQRVGLPTATVPPNGQVDFVFTITAPSTPGNNLAFAWQMVEEWVGWFGTTAASPNITVTAPLACGLAGRLCGYVRTEDGTGLNGIRVQFRTRQGKVVASEITRNDAGGNPGYYERDFVTPQTLAITPIMGRSQPVVPDQKKKYFNSVTSDRADFRVRGVTRRIRFQAPAGTLVVLMTSPYDGADAPSSAHPGFRYSTTTDSAGQAIRDMEPGTYYQYCWVAYADSERKRKLIRWPAIEPGGSAPANIVTVPAVDNTPDPTRPFMCPREQ